MKEENAVFPGSTVYGRRNGSLYDRESVATELCENPHLSKWWTSRHDEVVKQRIDTDHWIWDWNITEDILEITPENDIAQWVKEDPKVRGFHEVWTEEDQGKYAHYNVIMYFAKARAEKLGLTSRIRPAKRKVCKSCRYEFDEDSIWVPVVQALGGVDNLSCCSPCIEKAIHGEGRGNSSVDQICTYVQSLSLVLRRIPRQKDCFPSSFRFLEAVDTCKRGDLVSVLLEKPSLKRMKDTLGSWDNVLQTASIEPTKCRGSKNVLKPRFPSEDGYVYGSLVEMLVGDLLEANGVSHTPRKEYPKANETSLIGTDRSFIEYVRPKRTAREEREISEKRKICKDAHVSLVEIHRRDLTYTSKLKSKLFGT